MIWRLRIENLQVKGFIEEREEGPPLRPGSVLLRVGELGGGNHAEGDVGVRLALPQGGIYSQVRGDIHPCCVLTCVLAVWMDTWASFRFAFRLANLDLTHWTNER